MGKVKILVIEDDETINKMISCALIKEGYDVYSAFNGQEGYDIWKKHDYSLIILDIMLPIIDGIEVMRRIRQEGNIPILIVSAKVEESDKIIGLGLGADDYLIKPFSLGELQARVKAHLRRYLYFNEQQRVNNQIQYGDITLYIDTYTVEKNDELIKLRAKEYQLLKLFLENSSKVFTKAQIFNAVWGEEYMGDDNTVMVHIRRLRNKIEDDPSNPKYIETMWGIGYRLGELK
ncbi:response regulator transcription factor [Vallitalea okinawensis]|uniref:response regulator transcription factor n=1 Tax=Vallitalea okinawensis TaxID=2078660 RepID=UPI000CFB7563|nr:response regulator transcription factor [Vallitalea okinawensis]